MQIASFFLSPQLRKPWRHILSPRRASRDFFLAAASPTTKAPTRKVHAGRSKARVGPPTWPRAEKPRPGTSLRGSLSGRARLPRAASASWLPRTSFRAPHRCLAEARLSARLAWRASSSGSGSGDNGVAMGTERVDRVRSVRACSHGDAGHFRSRKIPGRSRALLQPRSLGLVPKLPSIAVASSPVVSLKGTLALRHEDAGRGEKSRRRMEEGAGLHDPTYLKLRRTGLNGRPAGPPGVLALRAGEDRLRCNYWWCQHCVDPPGKIWAMLDQKSGVP